MTIGCMLQPIKCCMSARMSFWSSLASAVCTCARLLQGLVLMLCSSIVPSGMLLLSRNKLEHEKWLKQKLGSAVLFGLNVFALLCQFAAVVAWPIVIWVNDFDNNLAWAIPLSLLFTSVRYWENYMGKPDSETLLGTRRQDGDSDNGDRSIRQRVTKYVWILACEIYESRIRIDLFVSLWKILLTFLLMIGMIGLQLNDYGAIFNIDTRYSMRFSETVTH